MPCGAWAGASCLPEDSMRMCRADPMRAHRDYNMNISERIKARLEKAGLPYRANDNISAVLEPGDTAELEGEVRERIEALLKSLVIDVERDPNTEETAARIAKMFVREVFAGRYEPCPEATDFPNDRGFEDMITVGPFAVRSTCSHHFAPILGRCWVGIVPGERVIGISKYARLAEWVLKRPQIQEEAAVQLADLLEAKTRPAGLAVMIDAQHSCMSWRGVKETESRMGTNVWRGVFRTDASLRQEFLTRISK